MTASPTERARWFRAKAEEIRAAADGMTDGDARRTMLQIADNYESMARRLGKPPAATQRDPDE